MSNGAQIIILSFINIVSQGGLFSQPSANLVIILNNLSWNFVIDIKFVQLLTIQKVAIFIKFSIRLVRSFCQFFRQTSFKIPSQTLFLTRKSCFSFHKRYCCKKGVYQLRMLNWINCYFISKQSSQKMLHVIIHLE